jgi:tetratricopeptide (TPR) repeat protein
VIDLYEPVPARPDLLDALTDPAARLERIRPVLGAMLDTAVSSGRPEYAWMLPRAAWRYLWSRGYIDDIRALTTVSRDVARQVGDPIAQAMAANYLASTFYLRGQFEQARVLLDESVRLREGAGDLRGLGNALANLSAVQNTSGRFAEAAVLAERALDLAMQFDDGISAELRLDSLSGAYSALGRHAEAVRLQRRRLLYLIEVGDRAGVAQVFVHLVRARRRAGDIAPEIAERMLRLAVRRMVRNQYLTGEADARADLGDLLRERGRYDEARSQLRLSLAKMSEVGDSREKPRMINMLARVHAEAGDAAEGETRYREALAMARRTGQAFEEAQALLGLGERREAHEIFTRLGVPEAGLAGVDHLRSTGDGGTMDA